MAENAKWYVIHTYSGYENKVAQNIETVVENQSLQDLIEEVRVPTETVLEVKDNKEREVERKIFPGYVLVKMILTDDSWYVIRNIRGVTGFVGPGSKPVPLTEKEVAALGVENVRIEVNYSVGDTVRAIAGPLEGFSGVVNAIDTEKNLVTITVSMLGRDNQVELELGQVVPAE
jgi:transcriptional antiterminator NusG